MTLPTTYTVDDLPGLNCGLCGMRSCEDMAVRLQTNPELIKRCIYLSEDRFEVRQVVTQNWDNPLNARTSPSVPKMAAQPAMETCAGCIPSNKAIAFTLGMSNPFLSLHLTLSWRMYYPSSLNPRSFLSQMKSVL